VYNTFDDERDEQEEKEIKKYCIKLLTNENGVAFFVVQSERRMNMTLAELREAKGMTVEELAKELKVCRMTVYLWETGNTMPTAKNLRKLAEFYELSMEEMLGVLEATKKLYNEVFL